MYAPSRKAPSWFINPNCCYLRRNQKNSMLSGLPATLNIPSGIQFHRFLFSPINSKTNLFLPIHRPFSPSSSVITFVRRRSNKASEPPVSAQKSSKKKKNPSKEIAQGEEEEDAFEALFRQLEEDLKNDGVSLDDEDDDFSEEDLAKLERELEEALKDDELFGALGLMGDAKVDDDDIEEEEGTTENADADSIANHDDQETEEEGEEEDDDDDENEEMPVKLKNWQRKRLAYALKSGRRKTSIKNLAAELCLDRAIVLQLLRDPPPDLLMLSATLPDKPASAIIEPVNRPTEMDPLEMASEILKSDSEPEPKPERKAAAVKVPVHEMQSNWSANKRIKKAQLDTLELVYRRSKRPTNAMVSNIVHVTNLPRKKVLKWFEDKRGEEGVPDRRVPPQRYQRSPSVSS